MTTGNGTYMETVSLNDDEPVTIDTLEAQTPRNNGSAVKITKYTGLPTPISEIEDEDDANEDIVVVVDHSKHEKPRPTPPSLPPLRVAGLSKQFDDEPEYVDPTLFSPEVSRHSMEQAHRRARNLETELKEMMILEPGTAQQKPAKITPGEALSVISSAFLSSITRARQLVTGQETEYDLLSGSSPSSKVDDLDTDGDGLQLSPDAEKGDGKHFQTPRVRPALKRISAYSTIDKEKKPTQLKKKKIQWDEDVLDQDEEFVEDEEDGESEAFVNGGSTALSERQPTPRPRTRKKRKKLIRTVMRRLTPREKEELYKERPDLMIVPNWAQKYREEMSEGDSARWGFWLLTIIGTLVILLIILILLIAHDKGASAASSKP
ncbi:hypothetical protein Poli38472_001343 [Pythium oligandrum]|uniref:Uncharacterized protein n=1 Tax=Pythium oligandrum TaxID=41045 RepID=A0A8K1CSQ3_PYTOL|nr:hypothetical protein Poli38472_001343 [Pythium oligandrum]|eukprot:TMW69187.1 hypothetical protein Poli38472_001343 [Pythium oligandrum]